MDSDYLDFVLLLEPMVVVREVRTYGPESLCPVPTPVARQMQRNYVGMGTWPLGYQYHSDLSIRNEKRNMPHHTKASMSVRCLFRLKRKKKDKEGLSDINTTQRKNVFFLNLVQPLKYRKEKKSWK